MKRVLATTGLMGALMMAPISVCRKITGVSGVERVKGDIQGKRQENYKMLFSSCQLASE